MKLGVNIDHVATVRQARGGPEPDPVRAARICEKAGAHSIVMHLREDRRHVQDSDLFRVKKAVRIRLNVEMSVAPSVVKTALKVRPEQVTLVPEKRQERTTEGGLDLLGKRAAVRRCVAAFRRIGADVSLFIDPDAPQIAAARALGADAVEFHTGDYANQKTAAGVRRELDRLRKAVRMARALGLVAHAGHGLDYRNVRAVRRIRGIDELNIGFSIVSRSVWTGLERAVRDMNALIR